MSQPRYGTDKDLVKLLRRAKKKGWEVSFDGKTHIRVHPPEAPKFSIPMSPGSRGRIKQAKLQFKKAGLEG